MINICHFPITVAGVTIPPQFNRPAAFRPILVDGSHSAISVLTGFVPSWSLEIRLPAGEQVIIPRFAPWVNWALEHSLEAFCLPLTGQGKQPDGSWICDSLEPAPDRLEVDYPENRYACIEMPADAAIHRAIPGGMTIEATTGSLFPPVPESQQAYRRPDGTVHIPALPTNTGGFDAIIVPQDGVIIQMVARAYHDHAILVTDAFVPGQPTRLFQVR